MSIMFTTIPEAIKALSAGKMIILVDDEHRENEGDLVIAADFATAEAINFMSKHGRGLICLPMAPNIIERLGLPMMVTHNRSPYGTAFTVSIEAAQGVSTGISAKDREQTIKVAIDPKSTPMDIVIPGHIFPLKAREEGVLVRPGQTEGSVDLARMAGQTPAAVICEIINEDGTMSRRDDLAQFAKQHNLPVVSIRDLIEYRLQHENIIRVTAKSRLPIRDLGDFEMMVFDNPIDKLEHFCLVKGFSSDKPPLVRVHSECLTGDTLGSAKCDCGVQLQNSLKMISAEGGVLIYLRQEGRGIGLTNKIKAYALQDKGLDTIEANEQLGLPIDARDYAMAYQILKHLGVQHIRLITNNPLKIEGLTKLGVKITEQVPMVTGLCSHNIGYLHTKKQKLGHQLPLDKE